MNRADFHKLTEIRIKEAKVLLDRKCYAKRAKDLYRAITTSRNGVLSWLKKYW